MQYIYDKALSQYSILTRSEVSVHRVTDAHSLVISHLPKHSEQHIFQKMKNLLVRDF
jgi:hypothetical protein